MAIKETRREYTDENGDKIAEIIKEGKSDSFKTVEKTAKGIGIALFIWFVVIPIIGGIIVLIVLACTGVI